MFRTAVLGLTLALLCLAGATHAGKAVDLPAITSENLFRGGQTLSLRGLRASESEATDLAFVNLAKTANRCTFSLADGNGFGIGPAVTLTLKALERRPFVDVFERLVDKEGVADAKATISCSQNFYAYALLTDRASQQVDLISPEASDEADNAGSLRMLSAPAVACPAGAVCFDVPGVAHIPKPPPGWEKPVGRVAFPAPAGPTKRLRLSLDVKVGEWYPKEPSGKHLIYWFVVNKNIDMPGLLYFRGPNKNQAFARHGVGLKHAQKVKIIKPFAAQPGRTYHVDNDYDMGRGTYTVTITNAATGAVEAVLRGRPNLASYNIKAGSKFFIDMGFYPDNVETEVPSYDWVYSNVHVEASVR